MRGYDFEPVFNSLEKALIESYRANTLKALAKLVCSTVPGRKADMAKAISQTLLGPELKYYFERLSDIEKAAVREAVFARGGILDTKKFKAKYGQAAPVGKSLGWRPEGHLIDLFIVNRIIVPVDLKQVLKEFVQKPEKDQIRYLKKPPESVLLDIHEKTEERTLIVRNTASAALTNLETVLRLVEGGKIKVSAKTGRPSLAAQKKLSGLLRDGDWYESEILSEIGYIQSFAWPVLLQGTGLAKADGSTLKLTNRGKKALKGNLPEVIKEAWSKWKANKLLDEFSRVDQIKGQKSTRGKTLFAAFSRRPALYEGLMMCSPGKWLSVDELIRAMNSAGLEFEIARYGWKLYVGDAQYGHLDDYEDQTMIKKRYVLAFLFEYAATLGIIDVGYIHPSGALSDCRHLWAWGADDMGDYLSRYDGLMVIRLNPLGAFAMEMVKKCHIAPHQTRAVLTVLPNHDVVITDAEKLSPGDKLFLEKTCQRKSSALWKLTRRTLLDAAQNGTAIQEIADFLKSRSAHSIPQTVKTLLDDAKKRSTDLEYAGRAHLIACRDAMLQKLLITDAKLSKLCRPAGEHHLVILPGKEKQFTTALIRLGYIVPQLREQI
jgi:hypothetical protein